MTLAVKTRWVCAALPWCELCPVGVAGTPGVFMSEQTRGRGPRLRFLLSPRCSPAVPSQADGQVRPSAATASCELEAGVRGGPRGQSAALGCLLCQNAP